MKSIPILDMLQSANSSVLLLVIEKIHVAQPIDIANASAAFFAVKKNLL